MAKDEITLEEHWFNCDFQEDDYDWVSDDLAAIAELIEDSEEETELVEILKKGEIYK